MSRIITGLSRACVVLGVAAVVALILIHLAWLHPGRIPTRFGFMVSEQLIMGGSFAGLFGLLALLTWVSFVEGESEQGKNAISLEYTACTVCVVLGVAISAVEAPVGRPYIAVVATGFLIGGSLAGWLCWLRLLGLMGSALARHELRIWRGLCLLRPHGRRR